MRLLWKRIQVSAFLLIAACAGIARAEEEAAAAKSGGLPEWVQIQGRLQTLKAKIQAKEKVVTDLIAAKAKEKDPQKSREIVKSLTTEHRDLQTSVEEYEQQRNLLKYRFPEKGMRDDRSYRRLEARSIEEMETQVGLDGALLKTVNRIREQYRDPTAPPAERTPASAAPSALDAHKRSILEPAVISK